MVDPEGSTTLEDCLARIRQLEEENAHLRAAAMTFGDLAERLKRALEVELRAADETRSPLDRRYNEPPDDAEKAHWAVPNADRAGLAK